MLKRKVGVEAESKPDRSLRKLYRATAARCRGRTVVLGRGDGGWARWIRERGLDAVEIGIAGAKSGAPGSPDPGTSGVPGGTSEAPLAEEGFDTAVVAGVLEHVSDELGRETLARAWRLLKPGGRLIVSVPNGDGMPHPDHLRRFDRRSLTRLLRPLGKPRLATDQPFRWITMVLEKPGQARRRLNRTRKERYRVTARLCRGKVIELGCGEGHMTKTIHDRGLEVVGVDVSAAKIALARGRYPEVRFMHSDIRTLALPDEAFDTVVLAEVLEHVREEVGAEVLAKAWRLVRPGGRLVVSVPNENCIPHRHHVRLFDRRGLEKLLRPLGKPRLVSDQPFKWLMMYVDRRTLRA